MVIEKYKIWRKIINQHLYILSQIHCVPPRNFTFSRKTIVIRKHFCVHLQKHWNSFPLRPHLISKLQMFYKQTQTFSGECKRTQKHTSYSSNLIFIISIFMWQTSCRNYVMYVGWMNEVEKRILMTDLMNPEMRVSYWGQLFIEKIIQMLRKKVQQLHATNWIKSSE